MKEIERESMENFPDVKFSKQFKMKHMKSILLYNNKMRMVQTHIYMITSPPPVVNSLSKFTSSNIIIVITIDYMDLTIFV